jgi:O-antigen/teichoic acid export membrane protein
MFHNSLLKNSFYYMVASLLPTSVGFLMLPIYTNYLSPSNYGVVALILSFNSFLPLVMTFQIHNSISRFYFDYNDDNEKLKIFISSILMVVIIISSIMLLILLSFHKNILTFIFPNSSDYYDFFKLGIISSFFAVFNVIFINLLRVQEKAKLFMKISLILFFISLFTNIILIIILNRGVQGVIEALLINSIISFIIYFFFVKNFFVINFNFLFIIKPFKYSVPLIPHSLFGLIFMYSDRLILERFVSLSSIGLYLLAMKIATILKLIIVQFNNAYLPHFNKISKKSKKHAAIELKKISIILIYFISLFISFFSCVSKDLTYYLFNEIYFDSWKITPVLLLGFFYQAHYIFSVIGIFYQKKTGLVLIATSISGFFSLLLNIMFIPKYGIISASYIFVFSYFILFLVSNFLSKKVYYTEFISKKLIIVNLYTLSAVLICINLDNFSFDRSLVEYIVKTLIICSGIYLGFRINVINFQKLKQIFIR